MYSVVFITTRVLIDKNLLVIVPVNSQKIAATYNCFVSS